MEILLAVRVVALLRAGCGGKTAKVGKIGLDDPETRKKIIAETINDKKLQRRGQEGEALHYARNQQTPYTGWMKAMYEKHHVLGHLLIGQIKALVYLKGGKFEGLGFESLVFGQNGGGAICGEKFTYKDGKLHGPYMRRHTNGQKMEQKNYKNGKQHGLSIGWDENGTEIYRTTYKDGEIVDD